MTESIKVPRLYHRPADGEGSAVGEMAAASPGLTRVHWDECRRLAPLLPPPESYPQGALGLFRGQTQDFILAHAHLDADGKPGVHYALPGADVLRQTAGRIGLLRDLVGTPPAMRTSNIPPLVFTPPEPPLIDAEIESLLELTLMLRDNFAAIEGLLAGVIQGGPVYIVRGPRELPVQVAFLTGLLTLLPIPARFGVTFATYLRKPDAVSVQVAFLAGQNAPEGSLGYDWQAGELFGEPPEDPYSRYIVQQLRLDASLAVEHMTALTRSAGYRLTHGDPLARALGWAARRVALDAAVTEGQPADSDSVAEVLREDPTLSDDLRVRYVRHLLSMTLIMDDSHDADVIAGLAHRDEAVAETVLPMLDELIEAGRPLPVYRLLARWLADTDGPEGYAWRSRAQGAAVAYLRSLAEAGDVSPIIAFLEEAHQASPNLMLGEIVPDMLHITLPLVEKSADLAQLMFLLAADYLPAAPFQRLLGQSDLVRQLNRPLRAALEYLQAGQPAAAPPGMLAGAAAGFGAVWAPIVLARLVEWILTLERPDLIDTPVLERLAELAGSPWGGRFETLLRHVVGDFSRPDLLTRLDPPGPRLLGEILLQLGDYTQIVGLLERISGTLFRGDDQIKFGPWVSELFEKTGLETPALLAALEAATTGRGLKPLPAAMAYRGALINKAYDSALDSVMERLSRALRDDPLLVTVVGYEETLRLVQYHARRQDADAAASLAAVITDSLAGSEKGLAIVGRLWTLLNWNKDVRQAALELLRRYVRQVPYERAQRIPAQIGRKLGDKVGEMLQATITVTQMIGSGGFEPFAQDVHQAVQFLGDLVVAYENKPYPTLTRLVSDLDSIPGAISEQQCLDLADDVVRLGRLAYRLGQARGRGRGREAVEQRLIAAKELPRTGLDALLWLGGFLANGRAVPFQVERETITHALSHRSVNLLLDDVIMTCQLLDRLIQAFPPDAPPPLTLEAFTAEINSLWHGMRLYDQRRLRDDLAADAQALAFLLGLISERGDPKAVEDSPLGRSLESGRREPKSALEVLRLISGYFGRKLTGK